MKALSILILLFVTNIINGQITDMYYVTSELTNAVEVFNVNNENYNGIISLNQAGNGNSLTAVQQIQSTKDVYIYVTQFGNDNVGKVNQSGESNSSVLIQKGNNNKADLDLNGNNIKTLTVQVGNDNNVVADIENTYFYKAIVTNQYGNDNDINIKNTYERTVGIVVNQDHNNNEANIKLNSFSSPGVIVNQHGGSKINIVRSDFNFPMR